jgi:hypothetical protein
MHGNGNVMQKRLYLQPLMLDGQPLLCEWRPLTLNEQQPQLLRQMRILKQMPPYLQPLMLVLMQKRLYLQPLMLGVMLLFGQQRDDFLSLLYLLNGDVCEILPYLYIYIQQNNLTLNNKNIIFYIIFNIFLNLPKFYLKYATTFYLFL